MIESVGRYVFGIVPLALALLGLAIPAWAGSVKVTGQPMHDGRISPMLFGNFVELLDDLVPGMRAEMLNDRSFEGVTRPANWSYYDGKPNICDREWDANSVWTYETSGVFNGARCAKLITDASGQAAVSQSGLTVRKGMTCLFSGYLKEAGAGLRARVVLKTLLPSGEWAELGSVDLPRLTDGWERYDAKLNCSGSSDRVVFEIQVSGKGALWVDKLSLMPSDNKQGWRKDVVAAIKDLRPSLIRWGGSVCDPGEYRWKDCIGQRDFRTPFPNKVWGRIDSNDVGIDEFCQFCELVGAEPLVCLSFSDGPRSAAELVRYCNAGADDEWGARRVANGHPEPYQVKYWQLGNELSDAGYANACPEFCKVMKRADPTISLMSSFPSQTLLDLVGKEIDYIGPHHYTPDLAFCENDFKKLSAMIGQTPGCEQVRIAVTEWNVTGGGWGLGRGKFLALESALQNASYLNLLMRYSNIVDIACRSNMTNSLGSGVIETTPAGLLKRPSYYMMRLYAEHAKPIPHAVEGTVEGVDLAACASEDGASLCVFAVNMKTEPVELALDLSEFAETFHATGGESICDTLDQRQPDVMNHWTAPDRVRATELAVSAGKLTLPALSVSAMECGE